MRKVVVCKFARLTVSTPWPQEHQRVDEAYQRLIAAGWLEDRKTAVGQRSVHRSYVDIDVVRQAARKNPGLIFQCVVTSFDSDDAVLHVGIGSTWVTRKIPACDVLCSKRTVAGSAQDRPAWRRRPLLGRAPRTHGFRWKKRSTRRKKVSRTGLAGGKHTGTPQPVKVKTAKALPVPNQLVFHGLPAEVERCRELVLDRLPDAERAGAKYTTTGSEQYMVGTLEFTATGEVALRVFNRLAARVPGVTVSLDYAAVKSGQRRLLRAVDGRIVEHRAV